MDLNQLLAYIQAVDSVARQALAQAGQANAPLDGIASVHSGPGQPINGSRAIILGPGKLTAFSNIVATMRDPLAGGGSLAGVVGLAVPTSGRNFTTGAFLVEAVDSAGFAVGTAQASFDWVVVTTG